MIACGNKSVHVLGTPSFWGTSDNIGQAGTALRGGDFSASAPMVRTIHGDDILSGLAYHNI
jgi:hypothetical protein